MPFGPSEGLFEALQGVQRQSLQYAQVAPEVLVLEHLPGQVNRVSLRGTVPNRDR